MSPRDAATLLALGLAVVLGSIWGGYWLTSIYDVWTWQHWPIIWSAVIGIALGVLFMIGAVAQAPKGTP